jgi:hypothetical protein
MIHLRKGSHSTTKLLFQMYLNSVFAFHQDPLLCSMRVMIGMLMCMCAAALGATTTNELVNIQDFFASQVIVDKPAPTAVQNMQSTSEFF